MNQSLARFLDDLDRRDEERRKDRIKTLGDDGEKKTEIESIQNQTKKEE
jgi:mRNA-degrading endonuclease RelE of RelBE toxin-antitoxin system